MFLKLSLLFFGAEGFLIRRNLHLGCETNFKQHIEIVDSNVSAWQLSSSTHWTNGGWSAAATDHIDKECTARNAERCPISMRLVTSTRTLEMDPYALICRPKSCQNNVFWRKVLLSVGRDQGANGFFWQARTDSISTTCAATPSLCTFEFNVCGQTISFPYDPATVSTAPLGDDTALPTDKPDLTTDAKDTNSTSDVNSINAEDTSSSGINETTAIALIIVGSVLALTAVGIIRPMG